MISLLEFLGKLGIAILEMIANAGKKADDLKKKYEETQENTRQDAEQAAEEQTKTKKQRSQDPWRTDMSSKN